MKNYVDNYDDWAKVYDAQTQTIRYSQPINTQGISYTTTTTTALPTAAYYYPANTTAAWDQAKWASQDALAPPKPKSKLEQIIDRAKMVFPSNGLKPTKVDKPVGLIERMFPDGVIPPIAGAAAEAEVDVSEDYRPETPVTPPEPTPARKKIVLTQKVGTVRDKDGVSKPIHKGSVELVRQLTGPAHETECVGIKVEHTDSSNHVEIPLEALEEAIERLRKNRDTSGDKGGRFFGK